jgi:hypothetical protein
MESIEAQVVSFARGDPPYRDKLYMIIWHDKGRSILGLEGDGSFRPIDADSAGALADLLTDLR